MLRCFDDSPDEPPMTATLPRPRRWTYADYCRIPADRRRHEIIDGEHFVSPSPDIGHQAVSARLTYELLRLVEKAGRGRAFAAPLDVHLGRGTVVQPDLLVVCRRNRSILGTRKVTGAPDLLIEILSPSRRAHDRVRKRRRYERAGVREFWVVDPDAHTVEQFVLRGGRYGAPVIATTAIRLHVVRGVRIDLRHVW
jgi:Uma2 family endonuclease